MNAGIALVERRLCSCFHLLNVGYRIHHQKRYKVTASNNENIPKKKELPRRLAAFDFDKTVVAEDTDIVIISLLDPEKITPEIRDIENKEGWMPFMAAVFRVLHKCDCTKEKILNGIKGISEVPGLINCLKCLKEQNCELIIISDSNNIFINHWLDTHGLTGLFKAIYTNRAIFEPNDLLNMKPHHVQTECKLSATNLCKGKILEEYIAERLKQGVKFKQLIYAGDGFNDICPVLRLKECDLACARTGNSMAKHLRNNKGQYNVKAKILYWKDGHDLISQIEKAWQDENKPKAKK